MKTSSRVPAPSQTSPVWASSTVPGPRTASWSAGWWRSASCSPGTRVSATSSTPVGTTSPVPAVSGNHLHHHHHDAQYTVVCVVDQGWSLVRMSATVCPAPTTQHQQQLLQQQQAGPPLQKGWSSAMRVTRVVRIGSDTEISVSHSSPDTICLTATVIVSTEEDSWPLYTPARRTTSCPSSWRGETD